MIKSVLSYSLCISIIAATLQIPVYLHTCHLFDVTEASLYSGKHCSEQVKEHDHSQQQESLQMNCCSLELKTYKADIFTDLTKVVQAFTALSPASALYDVWNGSFSFDAGKYVELRPPPTTRYNRTLLHFIQVFRL